MGIAALGTAVSGAALLPVVACVGVGAVFGYAGYKLYKDVKARRSNKIDPLPIAISEFISKHLSGMPKYAWKVSPETWNKLKTGFDHKAYADDGARLNMELRKHLAKYWAKATSDEKLRLADWIASDWGRIHGNKVETLRGYIKQADVGNPSTPFYGVATYSKIFSMKEPNKYPVYDAWVATSLNSIQLLLMSEGKLSRPNLVAFPIPPTQAGGPKRFAEAAFPERLSEMGFAVLLGDKTYEAYMSLLHNMKPTIGKSVLEIEMILFAWADTLCARVMPLLEQNRE
jgi:hypothetical protein